MEKVDFRELFYTKLNNLPMLSPEQGREEAWDLKRMGIKVVKKFGLALVFPTKKTDDLGLEIWLEDQKDIEDVNHPHTWMALHIEQFYKNHNLNVFSPDPFYRGEIVQCTDNQIYLKVNPGATDIIRLDLQLTVQQRRWYHLADRYNLAGILGFRLSSGFADEELLGEYLIGKRRENNYLFYLAMQNNLTYLQLMRLRILSLSAKEANLPVSYDRLAKKVAEFS